MKEIQLELRLELLGKIQPEASNDGQYSLKPFINRIEADCSRSAPLEPLLWVPSKVHLSNVNEAENDPVYQTDIGFGVMESCGSPLNSTWLNLDLSLSGLHLRVLDHLLNEYILWRGGQRVHIEKLHSALDAVLANLHLSYCSSNAILVRMGTDHYVHDSKNARRISAAMISDVVRFLTDSGYLYFHTGRQDEWSHQASWCVSRATLIAVFDRAKAVIAQSDKAQQVVLKSRKSDGKVEKKVSYRDYTKFKRMCNEVASFNKIWMTHTMTLDGAYLLPWVRRIFNGSLELGGRLYCLPQNLAKSDRKRILIDGEQTVEPDFKSMHFGILYAQAGKEMTTDPYELCGYPRDAMKQVMLRLSNTELLHILKGQITKSGDPRNQQAHEKYKHQLAIYNVHKAQGLKCKKPVMPIELDGFIEGIPAHTRGEDLISAIRAKHPDIAHRFGEQDIGLKLQYIDSQIMTEALKMLVAEGIPVLPIHDSIRCKVGDVERVIEVMCEASENALGVKLEVSLD